MPKYIVQNKAYDIPEEEIDGFLETFPEAKLLEEGKTTPTDQDTSVDANEVSETTESPSEVGSLDVPTEAESDASETDFIPYNDPDSKFTAEKQVELELKQQNIAAKEIMQAMYPDMFPTEEQETQMKEDEGEFTGINEFEENLRVSAGELKAREIREKERQYYAENPEELTATQSAKNSLTNAFLQLSTVDDRAAWLYGYIGKEGYIPSPLFDEEDYDKMLANSTKEIARIDSLSNSVINFTELGERKGADAVIGGVAAVFDSLSGFAASALTSVGTLGVGLFTDMVGGSVKSFNDAKAKEAGITTGELIEKGEAEFLTPATIGVLGYSLERYGLKKVAAGINSLGNGAVKTLVSMINAGGKEGMTEWVQFGLDNLNIGLAEGKSYLEAGIDAGKSLLTVEAAEAFLKGFAGGGASVGGGKALKASFGIRSAAEKQDIDYYLQSINNLENSKFQKNLSEDEISTINATQLEFKQKLKETITKNKGVMAFLSETDKENVGNDMDVLAETQKKINEINSSNKYTDETKKIMVMSLEAARDQASQNISDVKNEAQREFEKAIKARKELDESAEKRGDDTLTTKELAKQLKYELKDDLTPDQLKEIATDNFDVKKDYGFLKDGVIYLNTAVLDNSNEVKTASHELLHAILNKAVLDKSMTKESIETWLGTTFTSSQVEDLKSKMDEKGYDSKYLEGRPDEYLTQIYELNLIEKEGNWEKIGVFVQEIISKVTNGKVNLKFVEKNELKSFLRDYQKSIKTGKLSQSVIDMAGADVVAGEADSRSEEASTKVQELYDAQGEAAAFDIIEQFKPITSKIVEKRSQAPGFDRQLLTDEVETGKRGILDLIKEYKPESGVPLAAYINKFLPARAIEASKRILGEEFTDDITEAKGVATEEIAVDFDKKKEKSIKPKESLRNSIPISDAVVQKIRDAVVKTFGTKLGSVENKQDFKEELRKAFRTELKTTIAKEVLGTRDSYETFLRDNFEAIYEAIPQEVINKRFKAFKEPVLNKDGKQVREKTAQGNAVFKKKKISKAEFIKNFLGIDVGTSTKGTRKDALAETLAEEFAFDATPETIQTKEVSDKRDFIDKKQSTAKVADAIGRPVDLAFSKAVAKVIERKDPDQQTAIKEALEASDKRLADFSINGKINFNSFVEYVFSNDNLLTSREKNTIANAYNDEYKKLDEDVKKVIKPTFKIDGRKYTLKDFLTNKVLSKVDALDSYAKMVLALTGFEGKPDLSSDIFVKDLQNKLGSVLKNIGWSKQQTQRFIGRGLKAPAKIGNGDLTSVNGRLVYKKIPKKNNKAGKLVPPTNRFGIFENSAKVDTWINSLGLKDNPNFVDIYTTDLSKPPKSGEMYSAEKRAKIVEAGQQDNKAFRQVIKGLRVSYQNGEMTHTQVVAMLMAMNNNPSGLTRTSAILDFIPFINIPGVRVLEHMTPALVVNLSALDYIMQKKESNSFDDVMDNYRTAYLPKAFDDIVNKYYKDFMPFYWDTNKASIIRYQNAEFEFDLPLYQLSTGYIVDKNYNNDKKFQIKFNKDSLKALDYSPSTESGVNEIAYSKGKASKSNNNKLPKDQRLEKDFTNNMILDRMKDFDRENVDSELNSIKSLDLSRDFNDIIENKTGISSNKTYARVKAEVAGASKGKFNFFIPPSAEDFVGLLYSTLGKGSTGDAQMAWYKAHLLNPFARAMENMANDRVAMMQDFKELKKALKIIPKDLRKKIPGEPFTKEQAVRVYIWNQQGMEVPGLSNQDQKDLIDFVSKDKDLVIFAQELIAINKGDDYAKPDAGWVAGTIDTDFLKALNTTKRSKYLEVWERNVNEIFSEPNLNKLEAAYGKPYRVAMENILARMKTGRNRSFGADTITGRFTDWLTNSVGAIMFFNTRSAVLQTISAVNFINFSDNNVLKAGQAFANQPQYWKDFIKLFNSPFLLDRRSGVKLNVNEADIAEMAEGPGNSARNVIAGLLKIGFLPTQLADSFAIASGGASFYRNRIKALQKEGLTEAEAEVEAFRDFREIAEESQQSSRPDKISQQQAGPLGRIVLAFANTPAQYARLIKKAASDLKNGRGDAKTNISKIIYYGVAQNLLFSALQQALFAIGFGDDDEEEEKRDEKYFNIINSMSDSILRGIGIGGAIISVVKNTAIKLAKEADKKSPKYQDAVVKGVLQISPPISSKIGKLQSAGRSYSWNKEEMMTKGWAIDNPAYLASGNVVSAITNLPLDRAVKKITNIVDAGNENTEYYKRIALVLGWSAWELDIEKEKFEKSKSKSKFESKFKSKFESKFKNKN